MWGDRKRDERRAMATRLGLQWRDQGFHEPIDEVDTRLVPRRNTHPTSEMILGSLRGWEVRLVDVSGHGPMKNFGRVRYPSEPGGGVLVRVTIANVRLPGRVHHVSLIPRSWDGPNMELHFVQPTGDPWLDATFECDTAHAGAAAAVADPSFAGAVGALPPGTAVELSDEGLTISHGTLRVEDQEAFLLGAVTVAAYVPAALRRTDSPT